MVWPFFSSIDFKHLPLNRVCLRVVGSLLLAGALLTLAAQWGLVQAQSSSEITSPAPGTSVGGDIPIIGTAVIEPFQKYELHYKLEPNGDDAFIYFDGGTNQIQGGQLGVLRAADLAPGVYSLRLRVVKLDGNYAEFFAPNLSINQGPVATPTSDRPTPTPIPTATFTPAPQPTVAVGQVEQPVAVEDLIPTATLASESAAQAPSDGLPSGSDAVGDGGQSSSGGLSDQLAALVSLDRLQGSFMTGVRYAAAIFSSIALLYLAKFAVSRARPRRR